MRRAPDSPAGAAPRSGAGCSVKGWATGCDRQRTWGAAEARGLAVAWQCLTPTSPAHDHSRGQSGQATPPCYHRCAAHYLPGSREPAREHARPNPPLASALGRPPAMSRSWQGSGAGGRSPEAAVETAGQSSEVKRRVPWASSPPPASGPAPREPRAGTQSDTCSPHVPSAQRRPASTDGCTDRQDGCHEAAGHTQPLGVNPTQRT